MPRTDKHEVSHGLGAKWGDSRAITVLCEAKTNEKARYPRVAFAYD